MKFINHSLLNYFVLMIKYYLILLTFIISSIPSVAIDKDSLSTFNRSSETIKEESNISNLPILFEDISLNNIDPLPKSNFSTEIVTFEHNEVPVDYKLFKCHINKIDLEVQMDYNQYVKRQIDFFGIRWQSKLKQMITRSAYFFPVYEEILSSYEMPLELKYLSIIESGLNPFAGSHVGAIGPWQFMPATARIFDLTINKSIDERRSVLKSTHAACTYLKQMHKQYGDWLVALAAYNCGPGNVRKAMRYSGKKDFWGIYDYLPRETQNYVPKYIAMTYLMNFYDEYGIIPAPINSIEFDTESVYCKKGLDFSIIANKLGISDKELLNLNPEIKTSKIPFDLDGYILNIPRDKYDEFYNCQDELIKESEIKAEQIRIEEAKKPKPKYYYVRRGDCLPIIARKFGISVSNLKSWNNIKGSLIYPNQRLRILN